jgi:hypothetical protein
VWEERSIKRFGVETDHLEGPGIDGRIKLGCILRKWNGGGSDKQHLKEGSIR